MQRAQRGFQEQLGSGSGLGRVAGKGGQEGRLGCRGAVVGLG